jgi:hypothetical protein
MKVHGVIRFVSPDDDMSLIACDCVFVPLNFKTLKVTMYLARNEHKYDVRVYDVNSGKSKKFENDI